MSHFYQIFGTLLSVASLATYFYYFLYVSIYDETYISDNLERYLPFRIAITVIMLLIDLLICVYFVRFWNVRRATCIVGIAFVCVSIAGWFLLTTHYEAPWHMIGFGIFVSGTLVYWITIFVFDRLQVMADNQEYLYFGAAAVFCIAYCILYVWYNNISWIYEHIGMIFLNCANIYFFIHHNPHMLAAPPPAQQGGIPYKPIVI